MFSHHCSSCDTTYLFFPGDIDVLAHTDHGIEARFTCLCGAAQTELFAAAAPTPAPAATATAA